MFETILFDGTDIKTPGVVSIEVWKGALGTAPLRGDDKFVPLKDGEAYVEKAFAPFILNLGLVLTTGSQTLFNDAYRTLRRLAKPDGTVTLTRNMSYSTGNEQVTALARYSGGLEVEPINIVDGRVVLAMKVLSGLWYGPSTTIGAGTSSIAGDVRTRRMTVTVSAGIGPTVTNSTNGYAFTISGDTTTPVVVDVLNMTASSGGTDCSSRLSWATATKTWPMQLQAGSNTLTISSGTLSVAYQGAYL